MIKRVSNLWQLLLVSIGLLLINQSHANQNPINQSHANDNHKLIGTWQCRAVANNNGFIDIVYDKLTYTQNQGKSEYKHISMVEGIPLEKMQGSYTFDWQLIGDNLYFSNVNFDNYQIYNYGRLSYITDDELLQRKMNIIEFIQSEPTKMFFINSNAYQTLDQTENFDYKDICIRQFDIKRVLLPQ